MNIPLPSADTATSGAGVSDVRAAFAGCTMSGHGAPVVMLHSSLASKAQWLALGERMSARFQVIALDLCGYGDNPLPSCRERFSVDDEVRLVAEHVDRLVAPHQRVHLVGHSYGGLVALRFAQRMRGRVASLSLYEPVVFGMLEHEDEALAEITRLAGDIRRLLAHERRDDAARAFVDFWNGAGTFASLSPGARAGAARGMDKVALDFRAAWDWRPHPDDLQCIVSPTLLLTGTRSPRVVQHIVKLLARRLPHSRVATLDAGHMGPLTAGQRVNPWIEAFVDMCAGRAQASAASHAHVTP
jgi:pimeloyl-ACP methyl ester carboxylesterase